MKEYRQPLTPDQCGKTGQRGVSSYAITAPNSWSRAQVAIILALAILMTAGTSLGQSEPKYGGRVEIHNRDAPDAFAGDILGSFEVDHTTIKIQIDEWVIRFRCQDQHGRTLRSVSFMVAKKDKYWLTNFKSEEQEVAKYISRDQDYRIKDLSFSISIPGDLPLTNTWLVAAYRDTSSGWCYARNPVCLNGAPCTSNDYVYVNDAGSFEVAVTTRTNTFLKLEAKQTDLMPPLDTQYSLIPPMLFETDEPGPKEELSSKAWAIANEFVFRTALRHKCKLPATHVVPYPTGYMILFRYTNSPPFRVFVTNDFTTVERMW